MTMLYLLFGIAISAVIGYHICGLFIFIIEKIETRKEIEQVNELVRTVRKMREEDNKQ